MKQLWEGLRNSFFAGLLVVVPVAASVLILIWLFTGVTNFLLPASLREQMWGPLYRLVALVVFVVLTMAEAVIARVPLLNKTYGFVKEVSHTAFAGQKTMFQRVVLVEYPRPGAYTIAFATTEARGEAREGTGSELVSVILPTPPNPTTGYLALFPREQVVDLEMNVADAMKMSFSAGAVVPLDPATGAR